MFHLYSHNDLDGVSCGILARLAFGSKVEVRYHAVHSLNAQVERYLLQQAEQNQPENMLLITDLAVSPEIEARINRFVTSGGKVMLLDHHKTSLHLNAHEWGSVHIHHEDGRTASATSLLYEYMQSREWLQPSPSLDQFVEWVRLYDTWEWEKAGEIEAKRLNDLFYLLSPEEFEPRMLSRLQGSSHFAFDEFEEKLLTLEEDKIERYIRRKRREMLQTFIGEECVGIVYAESYHSELASELGKGNPHLDYIAILNLGGRRMSLRTIHDHMDVADIAKRYGGGGHAKAAGCTMNEEVFRLYAAEPFELDPLPLDAPRNAYNVKASEHGVLYDTPGKSNILLYQSGSGNWTAEWDKEALPFDFPSFEDAERHIKRHYGAWLCRDDRYVQFLSEHWLRSRRRGLKPDLDEEKIIDDL
ncbi:DHH family phosphoesterase [Paenibacillus sp. JSM ZJ436]|uniref:DHH family phosphoesterase n=1 Tax=Paenibacillus sp. JSM ZJ436 TaxID=3376190 RepID=UPI0037B6AE50